jgi:tRNA U34 5-methylaminomethyl-2-thiouridine-forming methyltransferase MnmC
VLEEECYDIVYFDAFAPSKQPEMWNFKILSPVIRAIKPEAILVTYCARGQFKRDLKTLHMEVKSPSGPPGKLEMVRATRHIF